MKLFYILKNQSRLMIENFKRNRMQRRIITVGLVYRTPNITIEENKKVQNALKEVSKRDCIIMGDFKYGHIQ